MLFIPLLLVIYGVMQTHYWLTISVEYDQLMVSQKLGVELSRKVVADNLDHVVSEIQFLVSHIQQRTPSPDLSEQQKREVSTFLSTSSRFQPWFDQIRYLDLEGNEIIRINRIQGQPEAVASSKLQNKSDRYYFTQMRSLQPEQAYISPLDLNIEGDQIELPVKPTIRVGIGIHTALGEKVGYLLVNYQGNQLINDFKTASSHISEQMMLVNSRGYWLISPNKDQSWGFMLDHNERFSDVYPQEWRRIQDAPAGQFENDQGLFSFNTVYPYQDASNRPDLSLNSEAKSYYWKVISFAPVALLNAPRQQFLRSNGLIYLVSLLLAFAGAYLITRASQRNDAAQQQNNYERSFRRVLENIQLAAITLDTHGKIIFCNDYFLQLSGFQREELLGQDWVNLMPNDEFRSGNYTRFLEALQSQQLPERSESALSSKQGQRLLLAWNNTYTFNGGGVIASISLLGRDVTQQREIEEQLVKLSMAVEQSPNTVMIANLLGQIEYVNPRFSELTGYKPEEVIGLSPSVLQSGLTDPDQYRELWRTISKGGTWKGTLRNRKKNGAIYSEKTTISPIFDSRGRISHYLSVKEDITERLQLRQEVLLQSEETRKNRELAAVGQMANMVAHDLRNPLSSIKMALQILTKNTRQPLAHERVELINISQEQVLYMEGILNDLLSYSCPNQLNSDWLTLEKLLETTVISLQKQIQAQQIHVAEDYQKGLPTVFGDPVQLRQIFSNLIINAIQAVSERSDPAITIRATLLITDSEPKIQISITDNGCGIDPCLGDKVFEPFFTQKAKGTGLGLSIVKQRVELHRGSISFAPVQGGGTQATLILPINPAATC